MKIARSATAYYFSELNPGDVFWLPDQHEYYMKTETKGTCNAVNLYDGELIRVRGDCEVYKVDFEIVIH